MAWPFPRVFAHRGGGTLAPENTLAGLTAGVAHGQRAVEFDAMLTKDGVAVLMHDAAFGRTIAGRGQVAKTTARDLTAMDAGAWFDAAFDGETVPTLEQAFEFCARHQLFMNVEIKPAPQADQRTGEVVATLARDFLKRVPDSILLSSFSAVALAAAQKAAPEIPRGYLLHRLKGDWIGQLKSLECMALHCNHEAVDAALVRQVRALDAGLFCYTVNSKKRAEELRLLGVDAICTDRIDLISADFFEPVAVAS